MSEYPGVRRATISYLVESVAATAGLLVVMGICCAFTLVYFLSVGGPNAGYAVFAYLGLCVYLGQRAVDGELRAVTDVSGSRLVAGLLGLVTVVYYNVVVFVATILAASLSSVGVGDWALAIAVLYPFYDAEVAERSIPLSVAGVLVAALVPLARLAESLAALVGVDADGEAIDQIRRLGSTNGVLQEYLLEAYDRRRNRGMSY